MHVIKIVCLYYIYRLFDFLDLVLAPSVEGNKVLAGEGDDNAAAVKIQVIRRRKNFFFNILHFLFLN